MAMMDRDPSFWSKTSFIQLGYGIWVNLAMAAVGLAHGFPAIHIPQLSLPGCTIVLSLDDISWIASVMPLFSPVGCMLSGFLLDKFGRKITMIISEVPLCIGWAYTCWANTGLHIIIARAITGIGCGMSMDGPRLYTAEISLANMRGLLGACSNLFLSIGMTIQATMGSFLPWQQISLICGVYNGILFLSFMLLDETPYFLLLRGAEEKARKVLHRLRARSYNVDAELQELMEFRQDNNIRSLTFKEKIGALCSRSSCKPFGILMTYVLIGVLSGLAVITFWAVEILRLAKSSVDAYYGNVAINISRLVFGLVATILLFHVGRKTVAVVSAIGIGAACIALGVIVQCRSNPSVIPQILLMAYMAFASIGSFSLPFLLMSELYPLQIRGVLMGISTSLTSILVFSSAKTFPYMRDTFGMANNFFFFGVCSFLGAVYLFFYLPETKDLTLQEIEEYLNARRPTLISGRSILAAQLAARDSPSSIPIRKASDFKSRIPTSTLAEVSSSAKSERSPSLKGTTDNKETKKSVSFSGSSSSK